MATLRGQNFRILQSEESNVCIGMATSCTVNLNTNTDDASTKDDAGLSSKPTVTSKSWQVSVESLYVGDTAALLTAMKSQTPLIIMWDETGSDNVSQLNAAFARVGTAYLSDATFTFEDRNNSTKSLQFTGIGGLSSISNEQSDGAGVNSFTKGQNVRLYLGSDNTTAPAKCIAAARSLSLHVSMALEEATTKDTTGDWTVQEPTGLSFDISTSALMRSGDTITSAVQAQSLADLMTIYETSTPVKFQIANTSGANNRTKGSVIVSGSVIISSLTLNAANRQVATYEAQLTGYGPFTVGS